MKKKLILILNVIVLVSILAVLGALFLRSYEGTDSTEKGEGCIDVNNVASFVYDICYDAYTKKIYIGVERSSDIYDLKSIIFSFFDSDNQEYEIADVPFEGDSKAYKIDSDRNPNELSIKLDVVRDFSAPVCPAPRKFAVRYCPPRTQYEDLGAEISPFADFSPESFITIERPEGDIDSDIFSTDLLEKEAAWKSQCEPSWECGEWGACGVDGIQRRNCVDANDCFVPVDKPETVRYCDNTCIENWQCIWSNCVSGYTTPSCRDLNNCGTKFNIPKQLPCDDSKTACSPDVSCGEWSECEVNYNFLDLMGSDITQLNSTRSRLCSDNNKCSLPKRESEQCGVNVDIYTRDFNKCGKDYIGIYNQLDNSLIARIDVGTKDRLTLNLYLGSEADSEYCDYCFNGRMDGDETGIDCGGGCMSCEDKYGPVEYAKVSWFTRLFG